MTIGTPTGGPAPESLAYASNAAADGLADWLLHGPGSRLGLLTHARPDGDAVGSTLAICRSATAAGVPAAIAYAGELPPWLAEVMGDTPWSHLDAGEPPAPFDRALVCDTGAWGQLEPYTPWIAGKADRLAILDHHRSGTPDLADLRWIDSAAAAACEMAAAVCVRLLGVASPADLPQPIAAPLLLGLGTDTGWFRHPSVTPAVLRLAADLIQAGADHAALVKLTMLSDPPERLRLLSRAMASLRLHEAAGVAVLRVTAADLAAAGASVGMTSGFADPALAVRGVTVAAVLTELPEAQGGPGVVKLSLRSKLGGPDVARVAGELGGGGHARAAGARVRAPLDEAERRVLDLVAAQQPDPPTP